jgi:hypothetical protein
VTFSSAFDWTIFLLVDSLLLVTLTIIFREKLYRRLFFFTIYLIVSVISDVIWRWRTTTSPYPHVRLWFDLYWSAEFLLSILRLLTFAEISRRILREYPAVSAVASWVLISSGTILLAWTAYPAIHNVRRIWPLVLVGDQRFALMQAILLLAFLTIGSYYRMRIPPLYWFVLVGIGIYSSLQVVNNELMLRQLVPAYSIPDFIRRASIVTSVGMWTYAVSRWSAVPESQPELIPQAAYDQFSLQIHDKMQELNDKLAKLFG